VADKHCGDIEEDSPQGGYGVAPPGFLGHHGLQPQAEVVRYDFQEQVRVVGVKLGRGDVTDEEPVLGLLDVVLDRKSVV